MKKRVREGNSSNIEKTLLQLCNVARTIRLVLRGSVSESDPALTNNLRKIQKDCPQLLRSVLTFSDREQLEEARSLEDGDFELSVDQSEDADHRNPVVINAIPAKEAMSRYHPIADDEPLPIKADRLPDRFRLAIRQAYELQYRFPSGQPAVFGSKSIQWSRKLAWNDRYVFIYKVDDVTGTATAGRIITLTRCMIPAMR